MALSYVTQGRTRNFLLGEGGNPAPGQRQQIRIPINIMLRTMAHITD